MFFEYFKLGHFQKMTTESSNSEEEGKITGGNQNLIVEDDLREMGKKAIKTKTISPIQGYYVFVQLQALFSLISPITLIVGSIKAVSRLPPHYPRQSSATSSSAMDSSYELLGMDHHSQGKPITSSLLSEALIGKRGDLRNSLISEALKDSIKGALKDSIKGALKILIDVRNHPVLIHCKCGKEMEDGGIDI
ncbi:Uncharacterized protein TCM_002633 [Theobroma cacao]|uniref:Uncharacterized protein n=1 Tax=Theobroma cacao TaxID=3641 RepID=A0A061DNT5_THECC|nr:Uncharacterized protein TCM_002633 [Theobroma cacao]